MLLQIKNKFIIPKIGYLHVSILPICAPSFNLMLVKIKNLGVAIDWIGKKIYWTDETLKSIEVSELDGKNRLKLFSVSLDAPRGIALDPFER